MWVARTRISFPSPLQTGMHHGHLPKCIEATQSEKRHNQLPLLTARSPSVVILLPAPLPHHPTELKITPSLSLLTHYARTMLFICAIRFVLGGGGFIPFCDVLTGSDDPISCGWTFMACSVGYRQKSQFPNIVFLILILSSYNFCSIDWGRKWFRSVSSAFFWLLF